MTQLSNIHVRSGNGQFNITENHLSYTPPTYTLPLKDIETISLDSRANNTTHHLRITTKQGKVIILSNLPAEHAQYISQLLK